MRIIDRYRIVSNQDPGEVNKGVSHLLMNGWQPRGKLGVGNGKFFQLMVRHVKEPADED